MGEHSVYYGSTQSFGRPLKFAEPADLQKAVDLYFETKTEKEWTITGLANWLDVDRHFLQEYGARKDFSHIIKRALSRVEEKYEKNMQLNNPTGSIFVLKNMGWTDKMQTDITSAGEPLNQAMNDAQLANILGQFAKRTAQPIEGELVEPTEPGQLDQAGTANVSQG